MDQVRIRPYLVPEQHPSEAGYDPKSNTGDGRDILSGIENVKGGSGNDKLPVV